MRLIRFYDNDQNHIDVVNENKRIRCVKVPSQDRIKLKDRIEFIEDLLVSKKNKFFNYYVYPQIIQKAMNKNGYPEFNYDQTSGLTLQDMDDIKEWASLGGKAIIFDLDRTLIKTEGFGIFFRTQDEVNQIFEGSLTDLMLHLGVPESDSESTIEDFFEYICGGKTRLWDLRHMFALLWINGVDVYIISSNQKCKSRLFQEIVRQLFGSDVVVQCSGKNKLHEIMKTRKLRSMIDDDSATKIQNMVRRSKFRRSLKKSYKSKRK